MNQKELIAYLGISRNKFYVLRSRKVVPPPRTGSGYMLRKVYSSAEVDKIVGKLKRLGAIPEGFVPAVEAVTGGAA